MNVQNKLNDVVWAKLRYCPYWPSRIVEPPVEIKRKVTSRNCCVYFFGSKNYGIVPINNVESYTENKLKYIKRGGKQIGFKLAVEECDEFLANNSTSQPHDTAHHSTEIEVKQELDFIIKQESEISDKRFLCTREVVKIIPHSNCIDCDIKQTEIEEFKEMKKKWIADLTSAKEQCQNYCADLKKNERLLIKYKEDYNAVVLSNVKQKSDSQNQIKQLTEMNQNYVRVNSELEKRIEQLESKDIEYEVQAIIDHKQVNRKRSYLVRWKGYTENDNTWEREDNLKCPAILNKYKKLNKLQ